MAFVQKTFITKITDIVMNNPVDYDYFVNLIRTEYSEKYILGLVGTFQKVQYCISVTKVINNLMYELIKADVYRSKIREFFIYVISSVREYKPSKKLLKLLIKYNILSDLAKILSNKIYDTKYSFDIRESRQIVFKTVDVDMFDEVPRLFVLNKYILDYKILKTYIRPDYYLKTSMNTKLIKSIKNLFSLVDSIYGVDSIRNKEMQSMSEYAEQIKTLITETLTNPKARMYYTYDIENNITGDAKEYLSMSQI